MSGVRKPAIVVSESKEIAGINFRLGLNKRRTLRGRKLAVSINRPFTEKQSYRRLVAALQGVFKRLGGSMYSRSTSETPSRFGVRSINYVNMYSTVHIICQPPFGRSLGARSIRTREITVMRTKLLLTWSPTPTPTQTSRSLAALPNPHTSSPIWKGIDLLIRSYFAQLFLETWKRGRRVVCIRVGEAGVCISVFDFSWAGHFPQPPLRFACTLSTSHLSAACYHTSNDTLLSPHSQSASRPPLYHISSTHERTMSTSRHIPVPHPRRSTTLYFHTGTT